MVEAFHFLRPWWLLAIVPIAGLVWLWIKHTQGNSGWQDALDAELLDALIDDTQKKGNSRLGYMVLLAMFLGTIGLAGPTWEKLPQEVEQRNDALVILLDLSLSMLAQDVSPSRIERARQKVTDTLRLRDEGLTGLVAYAGDAHSVVPLTDDVATIENLLSALSPEMMPVPGSNPDHALTLAHELFTNSGLLQGRILIITDGIDSINSVTKHRSAAFPISVLGIGTPKGGTIPLDALRQPGKVLLTQEGNQVIAMLDHQRLAEVAELSYGNYEPAILGDQDILSALNTRLPGEDETLEVEREFDTWADQGHWLALALIPLCLVGFRRGVILCAPVSLWCALLIALSLVMNAQSAFAARGPTDTPPADTLGAGAPQTNEFDPNLTSSSLTWWDSLWYNANQRGQMAMRYGEPERAVTLFDDPQWRAGARYRAGDYPAALGEFQLDESVTGLYNQGNSLARLGEYEQAIARYDQVLAADPEHEDAAFNKDLLERLLEEQQQSEQDQSQDQDSQSDSQDSDSEQDSQPQDPEESEEPSEQTESEQEQQESEEQSQQQPEQGEEQEQEVEEESESERDEKQEALEQWMRRVPDDPGGLLKRKFTHETKQRLRRGDYENRQGEKVW